MFLVLADFPSVSAQEPRSSRRAKSISVYCLTFGFVSLRASFALFGLFALVATQAPSIILQDSNGDRVDGDADLDCDDGDDADDGDADDMW